MDRLTSCPGPVQGMPRAPGGVSLQADLHEVAKLGKGLAVAFRTSSYARVLRQRDTELLQVSSRARVLLYLPYQKPELLAELLKVFEPQFSFSVILKPPGKGPIYAKDGAALACALLDWMPKPSGPVDPRSSAAWFLRFQSALGDPMSQHERLTLWRRIEATQSDIISTPS